MILTRDRFKLLGIGLAAFAVVWALFAIFAANAHADPVAGSVVVTDAAWDVVQQQGPLWGPTLLLYGVWTSFLRRNQSSHWIAQGRTLAVLTGGAMVLESVLMWRLNGAPSAGIALAAFAALNLIWHPTVAPAPSVSKQTGAATTLLVLLLAGAVAVQPACGGAPPITDVPGRVVDCAKLDAAQIAALAGHLASSVAAYVFAGTPIDWDAIAAEAEAAGYDVGLCALGPYVNGYLAPPPGRRAPDAADGQRARAALERLRAKAGGAVIRTTRGDL